MTRASITIHNQADRERAARWSMATRAGMRVEFKEPKRTDDQNAKLWAMLTEVAAQVPWHGIKLHADDWKFIFLDALKRELRMVPNIDGTGFVNLGRSSSDLSKAEMSDLIELIHAFGASHNVSFNDQDSSGPTAPPGGQTKPAADDAPQPTAAGNPSESSLSSPGDDHSAGDVEQASPAATPEASLLSPDWQDVYLTAMARVDTKPQSLLTRHTEALQMIGGEPNAAELGWMRACGKLTQRRLRGEISREECDAAIKEISG